MGCIPVARIRRVYGGKYYSRVFITAMVFVILQQTLGVARRQCRFPEYLQLPIIVRSRSLGRSVATLAPYFRSGRGHVHFVKKFGHIYSHKIG